MPRPLILYIASSLDGYIAGPDDDLSFLSRVEREGEDYGYAAFMQQVDTVLVGRRTYDKVMSMVPEFPHAHLETWVITGTARPALGKVNFYTGDISSLLHKLKSREGRTIFCDGGAQLIHRLLTAQLVDEIILSIVPVLLGNGLRLFTDSIPEQSLQLLSSRRFPGGLVQVHYRVIQDSKGLL